MVIPSIEVMDLRSSDMMYNVEASKKKISIKYRVAEARVDMVSNLFHHTAALSGRPLPYRMA